MAPGWFLLLQVGFSWFQVVFHVFMAPGLVFMILGGFSLSLMVPGWPKSEPKLCPNLQARSETLKTPKKVLTSSVSWPHDPARPCWLWPSGHDDDDAVASKACLTL